MKKVIVAGSEGLIGKEVLKYLNNENYECISLDLSLGHDLREERFVNSFFKENKANSLVNLFALNHHIEEGNSGKNLFNISLDSFRNFMEVNLTSLFSTCRSFAKYNEEGSIVNFSSTYGIVSPRLDLYENEEKHIGYSVSKSGVIGLSKHLSVHLAPRIRVNTVIPGGVLNQQSKDFLKAYEKNTPMGRMMNVKELCGIVEFLISDKSSYMTGSEIKIDGGWTAW
tara:strand:+ start:225 stop:902 length:678 start_codon:yes stop_codon:yes gene_type:complete